jgi:hypothetical protein
MFESKTNRNSEFKKDLLKLPTWLWIGDFNKTDERFKEIAKEEEYDFYFMETDKDAVRELLENDDTIKKIFVLDGPVLESQSDLLELLYKLNLGIITLKNSGGVIMKAFAWKFGLEESNIGFSDLISTEFDNSQSH